MIWLTWRQHRAQLGAMLLVLGLVAVAMLPSGLAMREAVTAVDMSPCVTNDAAPGCADLIGRFATRFESTQNLIGFLNLLPALIGAFLGAPLLAREFDHGTWRLMWTQSVSRRRWLAVKLALVGSGVGAGAVVFTVILTWWRMPLDRVQSRFDPSAFNFEGLSPLAVWVFSFAVGVVAGIAARRTLMAMAVAVAVFLAVRLPVEFLLRPHYASPVRRDFAGNALPTNIGGHDWVLQATSDALTYHPADRFWRFQLIEAGIYVVLAAVVLADAVRLVKRREW